jgi:Bacteriophage tail sheath protein
MVEIRHPGVYVEELQTNTGSIEGVSTSTAAFLGSGPRRRSKAVLVTGFAEFERELGSDVTGLLPLAVRGFFENGGRRCYVAIGPASDPIDHGLEALAPEKFSILCCPDEHQFTGAAAKLVAYCEQRKDLIGLLQSPLLPDVPETPAIQSSYAACYYPWLVVAALDGRATVTMPPAGHVAGIYARVDVERGVHHAPAGIRVLGVASLSREISSDEVDLLTSRRINILRSVPGRGIVIWGARTTSTGDEFRYVNVRRFLIFLEQSIIGGLQWAVFEPNGPELWVTVCRSIHDFLIGQWKTGALVGPTADAAFFVRCDRTTITQPDLDAGRLIAIVGVAPLRPAEFLLLRFIVQTTKPA